LNFTITRAIDAAAASIDVRSEAARKAVEVASSPGAAKKASRHPSSRTERCSPITEDPRAGNTAKTE